METPKQFLKSEPKEPRVYKKAGKCPIHKTTKLVKDDHECCGCCCSGCEPEYTCHKCEALYNKKYAAWFRKFGHMVCRGDGMVVKNGKVLIQGHNFVYFQFYHGGKPLKIGSWAKLDENGYLKKTNARYSEKFLVVS